MPIVLADAADRYIAAFAGTAAAMTAAGAALDSATRATIQLTDHLAEEA